MAAQTISIIIPMYNEERNVRPLYKELCSAIERFGRYHFEIIFVDDGSKDGSATAARLLARRDRRLRVVELSRNFGKEPAMTAGLHAARGDAALIMDADLQMPPRIMGKFIHRWEAGDEVVVGVFAKRNTSPLHKLGSKTFYRLMRLIAHTEVTPHATDYRLLDRKVINAFNNLTEHNRITRGLIDWLGFRRSYVPFEQQARRNGAPSYSMRKLVALAVNSFTAYSLVPLKLAGYLGVIILALSIPLGGFMAIERFINHWPIRGTAFLAIMLVAMVGVILACLGLISLYIAHIHAEVTNRPLYVIRDTDDLSEAERQKQEEEVFAA